MRWTQPGVTEASGTAEGMILTPAGWVQGRLAFGAAILWIEPDPAAPTDRFVLPGFVDLHVHGGGGADCMDGADAVRAMAAFHAGHGTTSLLATTVTAPAADLRRAAAGIGEACARPTPGAARVLGMHVEGPFISPDALGAQPPHAIPPDPALTEELCALAPLRVATIAPEVDTDGALLALLTARGIRVQIGHTTCTYAQARDALHRGATGFTHLFNAMTPLHHRAPGAAGCALAHAAHAEIIPDLLHVDPGALLAALRAIPGLYGVTDAVAAAGMPDGDYHLGQQRIIKSGGAARLPGGGLAGSILTMDQALRNLLHLGLPLDEAARRLSTIPAAYAGLYDRGHLHPGAAADLAVVDAAGTLHAVFAEGRRVATPPPTP